MSAFQAALKNYKAGADVKVNPPESLKVMEAQTAPEVEAPKAPAAPPVSVAAADSVRAVAPLPETETVKRSRRTKAFFQERSFPDPSGGDPRLRRPTGDQPWHDHGGFHSAVCYRCIPLLD